MNYKCPVCGEEMREDLHEYMDHTQGHIVEIIKKSHPEWVEKDGMCHKCEEYFEKQLKG